MILDIACWYAPVYELTLPLGSPYIYDFGYRLLVGLNV